MRVSFQRRPYETFFSARKTASNLSESVHKQLNMYAIAAGAAGVGLLALAQPSEAKIVRAFAGVEIEGVVYKPAPVVLGHGGLSNQNEKGMS